MSGALAGILLAFLVILIIQFIIFVTGKFRADCLHGTYAGGANGGDLRAYLHRPP
jgi:hypothetical protein